MTDRPNTNVVAPPNVTQKEGMSFAEAVIDACICCGIPMPEYDPKRCCDGTECGCKGLPTEPPICSRDCWEKASNWGNHD